MWFLARQMLLHSLSPYSMPKVVPPTPFFFPCTNMGLFGPAQKLIGILLSFMFKISQK